MSSAREDLAEIGIHTPSPDFENGYTFCSILRCMKLRSPFTLRITPDALHLVEQAAKYCGRHIETYNTGYGDLVLSVSENPHLPY